MLGNIGGESVTFPRLQLPLQPPTSLLIISGMPLLSVFESAVRPTNRLNQCPLSQVPHLPPDIVTLLKLLCWLFILVQRSQLYHLQSALLPQHLDPVVLLLQLPFPLSTTPLASHRAVISALPRPLAHRDRYQIFHLICEW